MECALRRKWIWTTNRSAAAKPSTSAQNGACIDAINGCAEPAPETNRTTATAAIINALRPQIAS